jgi:hypothetical protein
MIATRLPVLLVAFGVIAACQTVPPLTTGKPRIAGAVKTATRSPAVKPTIVPTGVPDSVAPSLPPGPVNQEPPPVPVNPLPVVVGGGGTAPTPVGSPVLSLAVGKQPANTWQSGVPMRRARAGLVAAPMAGKLYVLEGANSPSFETYEAGAPGWELVDDYDMASSTTPAKALRNGRTLLTLGVTTDALYAACGTNGLGLGNGVARYTPTGGMEGELTLLATPVKAAAGGIIGDQLVVAGGLIASGAVTPVVQRVDLKTTVSSIGGAMTLPVAGAASVSLNDKIYVFGGYVLTSGAAVAQTAVQVYDPATNTWRKDGDGKANAPTVMTEARHSAAAAVLDGKIYVSGGIGASGQPLGTIAVYDPAANTWAVGAPMPTPRALHALAAFDGRLWALGGFDAAGKMLTGVEVYQP